MKIFVTSLGYFKKGQACLYCQLSFRWRRGMYICYMLSEWFSCLHTYCSECIYMEVGVLEASALTELVSLKDW